MRRSFAAVTVLGTVTAALTLAGCGSSTSPKQTSFKSLNAGQQAVVENEAVIEVESNISSFATFNPYSGFIGFARVAPRRAFGLGQMITGKTAPRPRFQNVGSCTTITGDSTDADGDGIPGSESATVACDLSGNGDSITTSGSVTFADPTPQTPDLDFNAAVNLTLAELTSSSGDLNVVLKSQAGLTQSPGTLTEVGTGTLTGAVTNAPNNGNGTVKLSTNSNATYTYSGPDLTSFGSLPDGTFNLTGNWSYDVASSALTANLSFKITTPGGLAITSSCNNNEAHIESGEIDIKFGDGALVTAKYTGCPAQPTITGP